MLCGTWQAASNKDSSVTYDTFEEAIDAIIGNSLGTSLKLYVDGELSSPMTLTGSLTIDLNGHKLSLAEGVEGSVFNVLSSDVSTILLTIEDSYTGTDRTHTINGKEIVGGVITGGNAERGGGIYISGKGSVDIYGGTICGNTAKYGGGVYVGNGNSLIMNGGTICGNTAEYGGGVYVSEETRSIGGSPMKSTLRIGLNASKSRSKITDNTATHSGGGVYMAGALNEKNNNRLGDIVFSSGKIEITGNKEGTGENAKESNIYFASANAAISVGSSFTNAESRIGVSFAEGYSGAFTISYTPVDSDKKPIPPSTYFISDDAAMCAHLNQNGTKYEAVMAAHEGGTATCSQRAVCANCGQEYGELAAHSLTALAQVNKTCTTDGVLAHDHCSVCGKDFIDGAEKSAEDLKIAAAGHELGDWVDKVSATCSATGTKGHSDCSVCHKHIDASGKEITDLTIAIDENAHLWNEGEITVPATCSQKGVKTFTCIRNGEHTKTEEIPLDADAHSFSEDWTNDETAHWHAATCGHSSLRSDVEEHTYGEWIIDTPAKIDVAGSRHKSCSVCGHSVQEEIEPLIGQLVKPSESGGENSVIVTTPDGFAGDVELGVTEIAQSEFNRFETIAEAANGVVAFVYDITLKSGGAAVQPDGTLTVKMYIPENLQNKNFKLFHQHGNRIIDMDYTIDDSYVVVNIDKLSSFIFVLINADVAPEPTSLGTLWIVLIVVGSLAVVGVAAFIVIKKVRGNKTTESEE